MSALEKRGWKHFSPLPCRKSESGKFFEVQDPELQGELLIISDAESLLSPGLAQKLALLEGEKKLNCTPIHEPSFVEEITYED